MQEKRRVNIMMVSHASRMNAGAGKLRKALGFDVLKSNRGVALVTVLVLSAICLLIMTSLLYMVTSGTQVSGMSKNYKTALEAGLGGTDIVQQFMSLRGDKVTTDALIANLNGSPNNLNSAVTTPAACSGISSGATYTGFAAKMMTGTHLSSDWTTTNWSSGCNMSSAITPTDPSTYDLKLELGTTTKYTVYAKIVDTVDGNSGGGEGLLHAGVVSNSGEVTVMSMPYLYTIEIDAQNSANETERAKLQVLYQY